MISLVLTTNNRAIDFKEFCNSLTLHDAIQLIVIDQNQELDYVHEELMKLRQKGVDVFHLKEKPMSLSKARNIGLKYIKHKIVGFPDDDCIYSDKVISRVISAFNEFKGKKLICFSNVERISGNKVIDKIEFVSKYRLFKNLISYTCFFNFGIDNIIFFDEQLGVGTKFSSAEETDFAYRFLRDVSDVPYFIIDKGIEIAHPLKERVLNVEREKKYALGLGAFCRKNLRIKPVHFFFYYLKPLWINPVGLFFLSLLRLSFSGIRKSWIILIYRNKGFFIFRTNKND